MNFRLILITPFLFSFILLHSQEDDNSSKHSKRPESHELKKIFTKDGKKYMYGGEKEGEHFDITNSSLNDQQFHYGIGRERFPALIKPDFFSIEEADDHFEKSDRFLVVHKNGITKAYAIKDLTRHEVVNDELGGEPIMAAYCILADLGAIYSREYVGKEFTFALTGYTYYDPKVWEGKDGFVFWDRETESMWWPLIGRGVSGVMKGVEMKVLDEKYWAQTTWKVIKKKYPEARILIPDQDYERPKYWPKYEKKDLQFDSDPPSQSISPKWGENASISTDKNRSGEN